MKRHWIITAATIATAAAVLSPAPAGAQSPPGHPGGFDFTEPEVMATGLSVSWGMDFLPDGSALFTQRETAELYRMEPGGEPELVTTIEDSVPDQSLEAGLTGVAVSPHYRTDGWVYVFYTAVDGNRIARLKLDDPEPRDIVSNIPTDQMHDGGRLEFGPDGKLYATTGDSGHAELAQDPDSLAGKILRMEPDGGVPHDNPFDGSLVYSLGHRNVQGLAWDEHGRAFASELGLDTHDEINKIVPGGNYGWPKVEGPGGEPEFIDPVTTWAPAEASPSGTAAVGDTLYVGALRGERLWVVAKDGSSHAELVGEQGFERIRAVEYGPDGHLWIVTSDRPDGDMIVRFPPK